MDWKVTESFWEKGRFLTLSSLGNAKQIVVAGNFTNTPITTEMVFSKKGTWYNYIDRSESINVTSETMEITLPANSFKIFSSF